MGEFKRIFISPLPDSGNLIVEFMELPSELKMRAIADQRTSYERGPVSGAGKTYASSSKEQVT